MIGSEYRGIAGSSTLKGRRKSETFGEGRICSEENCNVVLSRYNPKDTCNIHTPFKVPRLRGEYLRK